MAVVNLYKHNARSYYDVYNPLIAAYPRKPTWIFKELSGLFDHQSELMNRIATDILYPVTRESAYAFAATCDYEPAEADGATDLLTITLTSAVVKTLSAGYQVAGISGSTGEMVTYETTADGVSGGTNTITVAAKQQKTYTNKMVGTVLNAEDFYDYPIDGYVGIIKTSISLTIDAITWTRVDNFDLSTATDTHFMLIYQSSGKTRIRFGGGTTGAKPAINSIIYATFSTTLGLTGRMDAGTITINTGADSQISTITNAGSAAGNDSESIASIIRNARGNVRLRDIVWTKEDLETAARSSSSSVMKAYGVPGLGVATIYVVPAGATPFDAAGLLAISNYVKALTQFGAMSITTYNATYVAVNVTATTTIRSGFDAATVRALVAFALTLTTCAFDNQIIEHYNDNGIDSCRENVINVTWPGWASIFTSSQNTALQFIIDKWSSLLGERDYREFGQTLEVGDLWIMGNSLYDYGCDVFSMSTPVANTAATSTQIISSGTIAVS